MQPGELDRQIEIQQPTIVTDEMGQQVTSWSLFAQPWAKYTHGSGNESFDALQRTAQQTADLTIRYRPGVTTQMRIVSNGQTYRIVDVAEIQRRVWLKLAVKIYEPTSGA